MTEAEAKKILERLLSVDIIVGNEYEAVSVAIKALEKQITVHTGNDVVERIVEHLKARQSHYEEEMTKRDENDWQIEKWSQVKAYMDAIRIVKEEASQSGWIPVKSGQMPPQPKENPLFENKPLELYLVDCGVDYPFRAFWNGKFFTDGWSKVEVLAWMPLPAPYQKGE